MNRYVAEKNKVSNNRRWYGWFLLCCLLLAGLTLWDRYQESRMAVQIDVTDVAVKPTDMTASTGRTDQDDQTTPAINMTEADLIP
ncbi:MAG: hypothetical protein SCM11_20005, partial [Bacillota bacterium]|nr:hypothetical protein [Bacillota bacterium]